MLSGVVPVELIRRAIIRMASQVIEEENLYD